MIVFKKLITKEPVLIIFLLLLIILSITIPQNIHSYLNMVHWETIISLSGLLILITGIHESNYLHYISLKILKRIKTEKNIALTLVLISIILSTFLTNDIALFILVPLTVNLGNNIENDIKKLIIFEAISVNTGSFLTPIGNPQNLYLWHKWGISFTTFIEKMLVPVIIMTAILILFTLLSFPKKSIKINNSYTKIKVNKNILYPSIILLILFLYLMDNDYTNQGFFLIFIFYVIFFRKIIVKTDWLLIILFVVIFIDMHILSTLPLIASTINYLNLENPSNSYIISNLTSQLISNVPASVVISRFSTNWQAIIYGVNTAGNGIIISSLANIIALRLAKNNKMWITFHKYSVPYYLITSLLIYLLYFVK